MEGEAGCSEGMAWPHVTHHSHHASSSHFEKQFPTAHPVSCSLAQVRVISAHGSLSLLGSLLDAPTLGSIGPGSLLTADGAGSQVGVTPKVTGLGWDGWCETTYNARRPQRCA